MDMKALHTLTRLAAGSAIAATAAFASAGLAQADGMPGKRVAYESPTSWSGFYFGLNSGWAFQNIDVNVVQEPIGFPVFLRGSSIDNSAGIVGGQIGLQHQFGNFVLGIEGGYAFTFRGSAGGDADNCYTPGSGISCHSRLEDILSVGPRLGWAMGSWMPYVTGGWASARFDTKLFATAGGTPVAQTSSRNTGWYVGAGVDMIAFKNWTVGLEYRHYDFGSDTSTAFTTAPALIVPAAIGSTDATVDTITLRVSWLFGRSEPAPRPMK